MREIERERENYKRCGQLFYFYRERERKRFYGSYNIT